MRILLTTFLVFMSFVFCTFAIDVRVGVYNNGSLSYKDESGEIKGFVIDIVDYVAKQKGWKVTYVHGNWSDLYQMVQDGRVDMLGPIAFSEKRKAFMDFTNQTLLTNWGRIYTKKNIKFDSIMDLSGKKIAVLKNDIYYSGDNGLKELLTKFGVVADIIELDGSYDGVFQYVSSGNADAGLVSRLYGSENAAKYSVSKTSIFFNPIEVRLALTKGKKNYLVDDFDDVLSSLKSDQNSYYYITVLKWFNETSNKSLSRHIKSIFFYAVLITLISIVTYVVMKIRINEQIEQLRNLNTKLKSQAAEREKIQQDLKLSEERLKYAVEGSHDGVWDFNLTEGTIYLSDRYCSMLGLETGTALIAKEYMNLFHPEDKNRAKEAFDNNIAGIANVYRSEHRIRKADGSYIWMQDSGGVVERDSSGTPTRSCGISRDITINKKLEEALVKNTEELEYKTNALKNLNENLKGIVYKENEKRKIHEEIMMQQTKLNSMGEMVSAIAHQWRQPLSTVALLIQDIKDAYDFDELDEDYINDIIAKSMKEIDLITETIDNFKGFFRNSGEMSRFDLRVIMIDMLNLMESQYKVHNIKFKLSLLNGSEETRFLQFADVDLDSETVMSVSGYENEFKQILINIFNNAKDGIIEKRSKEYNEGLEGVIDVIMKYEGESVTITIANNGTYIPGQVIDNIFDPYFTTKDKNINKGIGLYMLKILVTEKMNGEVWAENTDKGVLFGIRIPILVDYDRSETDFFKRSEESEMI